MTGKSREVADTMERRKIDLACVQETKWKAREIGGGFKLFCNGGNNKRNGIGIIVKKEWQDNIMAIKRTSDKLMSMKLVKQNGKINIVSAYAPQVGCSLDEKEAFSEVLEDLIREFPEDEQVMIGADLNGHVGTENGGYEQWHGGKIQNNKACDPDGVPVEAIRLLMQYGEDLVLQTTNGVVINGMPDILEKHHHYTNFQMEGKCHEM